MTRRLLFAFCALTAALHAQTPTPVQLSRPELTAEQSEGDETEAIARGKAEFRDEGLLLTADEIRYNHRTDVATARGHVTFTRGPLRMLADEVVVDRVNRTFQARAIRLGSYPAYIEGTTARGNDQEVTVTDARIAYGEPGPWQPTATAAEVTVSADGKRVQTTGAQVGVGGVRPLPFPRFQHDLANPILSQMSFTGGYRGSLGAFIDAGLRLPLYPGIRLGGDVAYFTERGVMVGPGGSYTDPTDPTRLRGRFRSGFINDHGDKKTDVLGRPVPEERGFVEWQHHQAITRDLTLVGQLNWWKDSEVVRDFRPREFFPVQQPDTFLELTLAQPNFFLSAFARLEPNDFQLVQQRLPEVRFDLLPMRMPGGLLQRLSASVVRLRENALPPPLPGAPGSAVFTAMRTPEAWTTLSPLPLGAAQRMQSTRFDAYYGLSRPISPTHWFTVTPVAGARLTHYANTRGATRTDSYTRRLGEVGFDAELRSSGTFAYKNEAWKIDGLRHLFTPRISYRSIPRAESGRAHIPLIDRRVFSTYLQPLGLGDARALDDLPATNTLRVEFDNVLQTRDGKEGHRDLLALNVAHDFRFKTRPGEQDRSDLHAELAAMPASWLQFDAYTRWAPQASQLREFNAGVTLRDGRAWSLRFANNFLHGQLEDYYLDGRVRLSERFDALSLMRYDARRRRFTEQTYGIVHTVANTWRMSYLVSFYSGRRRESGFGFSVQIDTVRF